MKRLFLHVGLNKTGTSSIQNFLGKNREKLSENGVLYPKLFLQDGAHHKISDPRNFSLIDRLHDEAADAHTVILSSEALYQDVNLPRIVGALKDFDIKGVIYLRPHIPLLTSWYQQNVQAGNCTAQLSNYLYYQKFSYTDMLRRLERLFGFNNLLIKIYDRDLLLNGDSVEDFMATCGLELKDDYSMNLWENNPSVSGNLLYMKKLLNLFKPAEAGDKYTSELTELSKLSKRFVGKLGVSKGTVQSLEGFFRMDRLRLAREFEINLPASLPEYSGSSMFEPAKWKEDLEIIKAACDEKNLHVYYDFVQIKSRLMG